MKTVQYPFSGIMDLDTASTNFVQGQHSNARNIRFRGNPGDYRAENINGTRLIANTLPEGDNQCIGSFYDELKQRVFWFNYNSLGRNGIYQLETLTNVITPLLVSFTNSAVDIFNFDPIYPALIDILYTEESDGDILKWTDRNQRPKQLNILSAINNIYGSNWQAKYLDIAKEPPTIISCEYENDNTATVNNLRKLYHFKYRFIYRNNEKSVWSPISRIPIPFEYTFQEISTNPTKNCRIVLTVQTGRADVKKIEIACAEIIETIFSDFFLVQTLDKDKLTIPNNDTYTWSFYNDKAYSNIDVKESVLLFDYVPQRANDQVLLNGDILAYGGITEGYDRVTPNVNMTVDLDTVVPAAINYWSSLLATQSGVAGLSTGNIRITVLGNVKPNLVYKVVVSVTGSTYIITYTSVIGDNKASILAGLNASAIGLGFTIVSITVNDIVVSRVDQVLERFLITHSTERAIEIIAVTTINAGAKTITIAGALAYQYYFIKGRRFIIPNSTNNNKEIFITQSTSLLGGDLVINVAGNNITTESGTFNVTIAEDANQSIPVYNRGTQEDWGLMYFDDKGETAGAVTSNLMSKSINRAVGAVDYASQYPNTAMEFYQPKISANINHRPPVESAYYQWVRTKNLTKQKYLYWITDKTYSDDKFIYLSIQSLDAYIVENPTAAGVISYSFVQGDRVRVLGAYNKFGQIDTSAFSNNDYEVVTTEINPTIEGFLRSGTFIKIAIPTNIAIDRPYYLIEVYSTAKAVADGLNTYYEYGERYEIGNPGTATRYHQGMTQNQTPTLSQPAAFEFRRGDAWYREGTVNVGNYLSWNIIEEATAVVPGYSVIMRQDIEIRNYQNADVEVSSSIPQYVQTSANAAYFNVKNNGTTPLTFLIKGRIKGVESQATAAAQNYFVINIFNTSTLANNYITIYTFPQGDLNDYNFEFKFSNVITLNQHEEVGVYMVDTTPPPFDSLVRFTGGFVTLYETQKQFNLPAISQNFSDFYKSEVNDNGRPTIIDESISQKYRPTLLRYSLAYQQGTNINGTNRFFPFNFDEYDREKGDIQRLKVRANILHVFLSRACGSVPIYQQLLSNADGTSNLLQSDKLLNNIQYYQEDYGIGNQYCSLASSAGSDYFTDPVKGQQVRLARDGITPISELYHAKYYMPTLANQFLTNTPRSAGGYRKIIGVYDHLEQDYVAVFQDAATLSFNEKRNGYSSFYSFQPEWIICAETKIVSWKDGQIYVHDGSNNNFYGTQYPALISLVVNNGENFKKEFCSLGYNSDTPWTSPNMRTSMEQQSDLVASDFEKRENIFTAAFLRDKDSLGGIINGDYLRGIYLYITLINSFASPEFLHGVYFNILPSQKNF